MQAKVFDMAGNQRSTVELPEVIFGIEPSEHAIYLDVKLYLANQRQGTHKSKERNEMNGSTRKLKKQKGTGGARAGDINSPVFRGGARVFGPRPRDYGFKLNKKLKQLARRSALSVKAQSDSILVCDNLAFTKPETKAFATMLNAMGAAGKRTLFVTASYDPNVYLSGRNIPRTEILRASDLNTYSVMRADRVVFGPGAIDSIVTALTPNNANQAEEAAPEAN